MTFASPLTSEQILSLAPDPASAKAGGQLSAANKWNGLGRSDSALWGECQGSGKDPYRTQIDLSEPAFKCSCPSRKFPCKHGLGLYLLVAAQPALFLQAEAPQWVTDWLQNRQQRQEKKVEKVRAHTPEQAEANAAQSRKREEKREVKVAHGLAELQTWLEDLTREGLASVRSRGTGYWDLMAARMVDAQAPGLAGRLKRAGSLCFQSTATDWERQLSRELASIYMLSISFGRLGQLPLALQNDVRGMIGWNLSQDEILAAPGVHDLWQVVAQRTDDDDRVKARRTWLRGQATGRWALVLHFAVGTQGFDKPLTTGTQFDGELCFYPSAWPLRAMIKARSGFSPAASGCSSLPGLDTVLSEYSTALASNPFLERFPMILPDVVPDPGGAFVTASDDGSLLTLDGAFRHRWHLLAISGGHPVALMGEWNGHTLLPLSIWHNQRWHSFESDFGS